MTPDLTNEQIRVLDFSVANETFKVMEDYPETFLAIFIVLEAVCSILSVLGNLIVIYVMISTKELARISNKYILSVAIADFLVGIFVIPLVVVQVSFLQYEQLIFTLNVIYSIIRLVLVLQMISSCVYI